MTTVLEPRANPRLLGQERALDTLQSAWRSGRLPHGWLLMGPRGVGKATLAYRFARALLAGAEARAGFDLPADHPVFRQIAAGAHPDLHVVEPARDPKTGKVKSEIPVDAVRAATAVLHSTSAMGGWRVVIVDGAEQLNRNAANALLKPLEEPPARTVLLLVSHCPSRVLPTLRSRCAKLRLGPLADEVVVEIVAEQAGEVDAETRRAVARLAHGSPGRALELATAGSFALYRRLAEALGAEPVDRLGLHELAGELVRHAEAQGFVAAVALIQELMGRMLAAGLDRLGPATYPGEAAALQRVAARRPLDRWAGLWEKIARLAARADGLNLDRFQVLLHVLGLLAPAAGQSDERPLGGASLGGHHVLG